MFKAAAIKSKLLRSSSFEDFVSFSSSRSMWNYAWVCKAQQPETANTSRHTNTQLILRGSVAYFCAGGWHASPNFHQTQIRRQTREVCGGHGRRPGVCASVCVYACVGAYAMRRNTLAYIYTVYTWTHKTYHTDGGPHPLGVARGSNQRALSDENLFKMARVRQLRGQEISAARGCNERHVFCRLPNADGCQKGTWSMCVCFNMFEEYRRFLFLFLSLSLSLPHTLKHGYAHTDAPVHIHT